MNFTRKEWKRLRRERNVKKFAAMSSFFYGDFVQFYAAAG